MASSNECLQKLIENVLILLNNECIDSIVSSDNKDGSNMQLKSKVISLLLHLNDDQKEKYVLIVDKLNEQINEWRSKIQINDYIDVLWQDAWYLCKVNINNND